MSQYDQIQEAKITDEERQEIRQTLWNLQDIIANTLTEIASLGVGFDEYDNYLEAYNYLTRYATDSLVKNYEYRSKVNRK